MATEDLNITCNYDPTSGTLTCTPDTVTVDNTDTGDITVTLTATTGTIVARSNPVTWTDGEPPGVTVSGGGTSTITIDETNDNDNADSVSYPFNINYTYTPAGGGPPINGTGDPTIVNEGTGGAQASQP